jgi:hypothetical protein
MTRHASFRKVVRRLAAETGQRYTEALTDLQGLGARMSFEPVPERLLALLRSLANDRIRKRISAMPTGPGPFAGSSRISSSGPGSRAAAIPSR